MYYAGVGVYLPIYHSCWLFHCVCVWLGGSQRCGVLFSAGRHATHEHTFENSSGIFWNCVGFLIWWSAWHKATRASGTINLRCVEEDTKKNEGKNVMLHTVDVNCGVPATATMCWKHILMMMQPACLLWHYEYISSQNGQVHTANTNWHRCNEWHTYNVIDDNDDDDVVVVAGEYSMVRCLVTIS